MTQKKQCPCGKWMDVPQYRIKRKKYCSIECKRKYCGRRSGLNYKIIAINRGWFKEGQGWLKGKPHNNLRKERPGYDAIHEWVERWKDDPEKCEKCESIKNLEWSNISGEYKRDLSDWQRLCKKCHHRYDFDKFGARMEFFRTRK